jgi:hypothetical protein
MRIDINLATQPYRDERRFYAMWGGALALMILMSALLVGFAVWRMRESRAHWALVRQKQAKITELERVKSDAISVLNRPENRGTRERSQFLNEAILRKSFSWTQVLADLEKLMPPRIHVVSITPALDKENRIQVKMQVAGENRSGAVQLVEHLEKSPHFRSPRLTTEGEDKPQGGVPGIKAEIEAFYVPAAAKPEARGGE